MGSLCDGGGDGGDEEEVEELSTFACSSKEPGRSGNCDSGIVTQIEIVTRPLSVDSFNY